MVRNVEVVGVVLEPAGDEEGQREGEGEGEGEEGGETHLVEPLFLF